MSYFMKGDTLLRDMKTYLDVRRHCIIVHCSFHTHVQHPKNSIVAMVANQTVNQIKCA